MNRPQVHTVHCQLGPTASHWAASLECSLSFPNSFFSLTEKNHLQDIGMKSQNTTWLKRTLLYSPLVFMFWLSSTFFCQYSGDRGKHRCRVQQLCEKKKNPLSTPGFGDWKSKGSWKFFKLPRILAMGCRAPALALEALSSGSGRASLGITLLLVS